MIVVVAEPHSTLTLPDVATMAAAGCVVSGDDSDSDVGLVADGYGVGLAAHWAIDNVSVSHDLLLQQARIGASAESDGGLCDALQTLACDLAQLDQLLDGEGALA